MRKKLALDPGPPPRRRTSFCKCLCLAVTIPVACFIVWVVGMGAWKGVNTVRHPHQALYYGSAKNATDAKVYPLLQDQDSFDVLATVFLRATKDEEAALAASQGLSATRVAAAPSASVMELKKFGKVEVKFGINDTDVVRVDRPLFSDIIFRGLRSTDKHRVAQVKFQLPTNRFKDVYTNTDLRAAFLLIPSSPSLIDHVKNYSSWIPESVKLPLMRPETIEEKTILDLALESFAVSIPLLQTHQIPSICQSTNATDGVGSPLINSTTRQPYVVTRTQLRLIRQTRIFNATAYNISHQQLRRTSCGQGFGFQEPVFSLCNRQYSSNGNLETLLELDVPEEGRAGIRWAYAPYLDTKAEAAGPKDIVRIPVTRNSDPCATGNDTDPEFLDVTWNIGFAARSPSKKFIGDLASQPQAFNHSLTDCDKMNGQDSAEVFSGLFGHRFYDDVHPRRRIGIDVVTYGCGIVADLLLLPYWWTRLSTVGISSSGAFLIIGSILLQLPLSFSDQVHRHDHNERDRLIFVLLFAVTMTLIPPAIMLRTLLRAEFGWKKWYPTVTRSPATHQERRSERVDRETSWLVKLAIAVGVALAFHFGKLYDIHIIAAYSPIDCPPDAEQHGALYNFLSRLGPSLHLTGDISQYILNHRLKSFGGQYRAAEILGFVASMAHLLHYVPAFVGRREFRSFLSVGWFLSALVFRLPMLWQALTLPPVKVVENDED
ncbi:hypothetical protein MIND_01085000 [Mycena indigotica]|uniref:Uncharacterized protein n=1 Tax=Mycena indigotica TaxID=2126181 RepID=A0A8H6SBU1_9AGAR|nr:uncharacterized protein MIND_01085000 [Mycena indigotica]KAF7295452.1 hypothetical protein MIND_01085000 [Mycena indigotica]